MLQKLLTDFFLLEVKTLVKHTVAGDQNSLEGGRESQVWLVYLKHDVATQFCSVRRFDENH